MQNIEWQQEAQTITRKTKKSIGVNRIKKLKKIFNTNNSYILLMEYGLY